MNKNIDLTDKEVAVNFYDKRYQEGYMEEWGTIKKNKVREVLNQLNLPQKGKVLDFGCGSSVFTKILKEVLPGWEVFGVEISTTEWENKKNRIQWK